MSIYGVIVFFIGFFINMVRVWLKCKVSHTPSPETGWWDMMYLRRGKAATTPLICSQVGVHLWRSGLAVCKQKWVRPGLTALTYLRQALMPPAPSPTCAYYFSLFYCSSFGLEGTYITETWHNTGRNRSIPASISTHLPWPIRSG